MATYVDGFVLPIKKKDIEAYRKLAKKAARFYLKHGALAYQECVGDDLHITWGAVQFPKMVKVKKDETVLFSWVIFKSRAHRDRVNKKMMSDPDMRDMPEKAPFDMKRMAYGGFKTLIDLK